MIKNALSCPKGGLVLAWHDDATNEWGTLGSWALFPSAITYKPKINIRKAQGESTRVGTRQESGISDDNADIVEEYKGVSGRTVNRRDRLVRRLRQVQVPEESRADISAHGFWKRGTTAMFDI